MFATQASIACTVLKLRIPMGVMIQGGHALRGTTVLQVRRILKDANLVHSITRLGSPRVYLAVLGITAMEIHLYVKSRVPRGTTARTEQNTVCSFHVHVDISVTRLIEQI